ncbi:MAG: bifunctional 3,4-dihydroxy-2-butanone-4-phosphate synthase/GTP cyclohydrolase II [Candidatus Omnitrophica bacterium]|nr:bifunctional 3,4-dihydroxy-2-butanone-4-phosphate synthase/GTP cyclohydrolase II [Candidatus Omnitrophota bacterium]
MPTASIKEIIEDIRQGHMVIMTDDENRENEGDLIFAATQVTPEKVNFMMTHGRGLICVPLPEERLEELNLKEMTFPVKDHMKTAFTVSVDARLGVSTGISAHDRARTIEVLADSNCQSGDLVTPGHIFPLKAKKGGVLVRAGHTEAACDLARLAGMQPYGVICEIINDDGSMARLPDLKVFAEKHGLKMGTIRDLIEYRRQFDRLIERMSSARIPTVFGEWDIHIYRSLVDGREHVLLVKGKLPADNQPVLVRVHSECFTGDILGSLRCDCQDQLIASMERIEKEGQGVILYMRQEGRGIGLANKIKAYALQDKGMDTVQANEELGFKPDLREYGTGAQILKDIGLSKLRLMTNNPRKIVGLDGYGLEVVERVPLSLTPHHYNAKYLKAKKEKLGHYLHL